ncbi:hypothetical protein H4R18_000202 [Coemansia javaensis]|uniref:Uncharacterized protein n=1 Tax=Coemansia javaensis TaxID=2761396 RepID=A0A9W8HKF0_9FUNG|nr:hypothetical protein H4R18_000202 [Coemansia javaensis]
MSAAAGRRADAPPRLDAAFGARTAEEEADLAAADSEQPARPNPGDTHAVREAAAAAAAGIAYQLRQLAVEPSPADRAARAEGGFGGANWDFLSNAAQMFGRPAELSEVTAADIRRGFDMQGYQWGGREAQRRMYMSYRREVYPQHQSVPHDVREVQRAARCVEASGEFYRFRYSATGDEYRCKVGHFQLRDLLWATSSYDVFYCHADGIRCWNPWLRTRRCVLGRAEMPPAFRLSALCADRGIVFAGDFRGRYCVRSLWADGTAAAAGSLSAAADDSDSSIVTHASPGVLRGSAPQIVVAQNTGRVSVLDVGRLQVSSTAQFDWAVNCTAQTAGWGLACIAGDSTECLLTDPRQQQQQHRTVARLRGHRDHVFACAFSPDDRLVATGSQDTSVRVYDVRRPLEPLAAVCGHMGAMRIVRFSPCGRFLLAAEPADNVHIYDAATFDRAQDIEFMGEVAGAAFSPDAACVFVSIADAMHRDALVEFARCSRQGGWL